MLKFCIEASLFMRLQACHRAWRGQ